MHINTLPHTFYRYSRKSSIICVKLKNLKTNIYSGRSLWTLMPCSCLYCACSLVRRTEAGVSHCPNSNFSLKSGVCDVRRLRAAGVKVCICICLLTIRKRKRTLIYTLQLITVVNKQINLTSKSSLRICNDPKKKQKLP
jgi:hypothetical protein